MKKILGIVLFLGCILAQSGIASEAAYAPTKSWANPLCLRTAACKTLKGYVEYKGKGCLQNKSDSSCATALCKGQCMTDVKEGESNITYTNKSDVTYRLGDTCIEICKYVRLDNEFQIQTLEKNGVLKKGSTSISHAETVAAGERLERQRQHQAKTEGGNAKLFEKDLGTFGLSGLAKLDAKRKWEQKWLNAYIDMYNKHIQYATNFYNQRIGKLRNALEAQEQQVKERATQIETKYINITLSSNLKEKLNYYKTPLAVRKALCPPPCKCTGNSCSMARPSTEPLPSNELTGGESMA